MRTRPGDMALDLALDMALDLALIERPDVPNSLFGPVWRESDDTGRINVSPLTTSLRTLKLDFKILLPIFRLRGLK